MTQEQALNAFKKALEHKEKAMHQFEAWLKERGIQGKVVAV